MFFFTREVDTNLGYIWYRKDGDTQFGMGVRQAEGEEVQQYVENFALHNAPPGTMQRMAVYFLASPDSAEATREAVMAYTHGDVFKPVPGYKPGQQIGKGGLEKFYEGKLHGREGVRFDEVDARGRRSTMAFHTVRASS